MKRIVFFVIATALMVGCASLNQNTAATAAIQIGVMKVVEVDAGNERQRAEKIIDIASEARTFLDTADVSVPVLEAAINARLAALDLAPSDRLLAGLVVQSVVGELNVRVGSGLLSAEQRLTVSQVLSAVEKAASFYL
jgi:uncharacterized protein YceK